MKTKIGICILLFSFILFPMSPSISIAQESGSGAAVRLRPPVLPQQKRALVGV
jgi:hypothetical protein